MVFYLVQFVPKNSLEIEMVGAWRTPRPIGRKERGYVVRNLDEYLVDGLCGRPLLVLPHDALHPQPSDGGKALRPQPPSVPSLGTERGGPERALVLGPRSHLSHGRLKKQGSKGGAADKTCTNPPSQFLNRKKQLP